METENRREPKVGLWSARWYHFLYALSFGLGGAIFPPEGAVTIAGWAGGALGSLTSAFLVVGAMLALTRQVDNWRPQELVGHYVPDSRFKFVVFSGIAVQLFVLGTALTAGVKTTTIFLLLGPFSVILAGAVLGDMLRLRKRGIQWQSVKFVYPVAALILGPVGGLVYWYRRGRKRSEWLDAELATEADTSVQDESESASSAAEESKPPETAESESGSPKAADSMAESSEAAESESPDTKESESASKDTEEPETESSAEKPSDEELSDDK